MSCPAYAGCGGCIYCDASPDGYGLTQSNVSPSNELDPPCTDCIGQDKCPYCQCACNLRAKTCYSDEDCYCDACELPCFMTENGLVTGLQSTKDNPMGKRE